MRFKRSTAKNSNIMYHVGTALVVTAWGISFISTRLLLDYGFHPIEIYIYRFILAYIAMLAISHKRILSNSWKDEGLFVMLGLLGGSMYFIAENVALEYTYVSNVSLITSLSPLLTVLLASALYKSNRPGKEILIGSSLAFIGVGFVIFNSSFSLSIKPLGDILALLAALSFAAYSILIKKLNALYDAFFITRKVFFYGVITAIPALLVEPEVTSPSELFHVVPMVNFLFLGLGCSLFAFLMWSLAVGKIGAITASNYMYFQPVVTLVFSYIILNEKITLIGYIGCALILIGVWLSDYLERRRERLYKNPL